MDNVTYFKIRKDGCGAHGTSPGIDRSVRLTMGEQTDYGLTFILIEKGDGITWQHNLAAARELVRRYPNGGRTPSSRSLIGRAQTLLNRFDQIEMAKDVDATPFDRVQKAMLVATACSDIIKSAADKYLKKEAVKLLKQFARDIDNEEQKRRATYFYRLYS